MRQRLVVMARWPAPGRCKLRLAASCGSRTQAAAMQKQLSWHTIRTATVGAQEAKAEVLLAAAGLGPRALRRWKLQLGDTAAPLLLGLQGGGNLGCRMQRQLQRGFAAGCERVVLIGSDLPGLESADLQQAFAQLQESSLVLGPASDGGYWLIGLDRRGFAHCGASLMSGIPWGSDQVLATTLERAARAQQPVGLLRVQSDLDRVAALRPWLEVARLRR
jgi:rSAM/selenodomain-associated transferase 1